MYAAQLGHNLVKGGFNCLNPHGGQMIPPFPLRELPQRSTNRECPPENVRMQAVYEGFCQAIVRYLFSNPYRAVAHIRSASLCGRRK
jgi:hypothetical protein